jgi:hypothetical protein
MIITEEEAKRELQRRRRKEKHWHHVGGIVFDTALLLESLARVGRAGMTEYDQKHLATAQRMGMLVANHALQTVLSAINDEAMDSVVL